MSTSIKISPKTFLIYSLISINYRVKYVNTSLNLFYLQILVYFSKSSLIFLTKSLKPSAFLTM